MRPSQEITFRSSSYCIQVITFPQGVDAVGNFAENQKIAAIRKVFPSFVHYAPEYNLCVTKSIS